MIIPLLVGFKSLFMFYVPLNFVSKWRHGIISHILWEHSWFLWASFGVYDTPPVSMQYSGVFFDGTQYAKGWYAVRRNSVISYPDINFYFKKVQFSPKNNTHDIQSQITLKTLRARFARALWGSLHHLYTSTWSWGGQNLEELTSNTHLS